MIGKELLSQECLFANKLGIDPDPVPCSGGMTRHHVLYRSEGGRDELENLVPMCEGHQVFIHRDSEWEEREEVIFDIAS